MNQETLNNCKLLIDNRDKIKPLFLFDEGAIHLACASVYTMKGKAVDANKLRDCKELIKEQTGVFNNFRSYGFSCIAAMMASSDDPEHTLKNGLSIYSMLKEEFFTSEYLPFAAMSIAQMADPSDFRHIVEKTRSIYDRMKAQHWFLTGSEDSTLCALMALSDKSEDELMGNAELCYETLKPAFFSGDAVQSLSHVLALSDVAPQDACERTMQMFMKLKAAGHKYGTDYELPTLGVLAMTDADFDGVVSKMIEVDAWLSKQKGFGIFSSVSKKARLMYSGMLVQKSCTQNPSFQATALNSMISLMIAEEVMMDSIIAASAATVVISSTSN